MRRSRLRFLMVSAWFWRFAVGLSIVFLPFEAGATPSEGPRFGYQAPVECPTGADFAAQVAARTSSFRAPSSPFALTVAIEPDAHGLVGRVTFARAEQSTVRELRAARCNELVQALTLIVAILIDPQASVTPTPTDENLAPSVQLPPAAAPARPPPPTPIWFIAGPEVALDTAVTREAAVVGRLFFGIGRGDHSLALSSARLSFSRVSAHESSPVSSYRAEFVRETARLDGCLLRLRAGGLAFEPCPFIELGRLRAIGIHSTGSATRNQLWSSLGLVLRPTWTFSRRLVLGAGIGVQLPLGRYRFSFTGEPEVTHTPVVGFEASFGLGVRFP